MRLSVKLFYGAVNKRNLREMFSLLPSGSYGNGVTISFSMENLPLFWTFFPISLSSMNRSRRSLPSPRNRFAMSPHRSYLWCQKPSSMVLNMTAFVAVGCSLLQMKKIIILFTGMAEGAPTVKLRLWPSLAF